MAWHQTTLTVPAKPRGFHLITGEVKRAVAGLAPVDVGVLHSQLLDERRKALADQKDGTHALGTA